MMERTSLFTAQEFIDKLRRDEIAAPLTLTGLVKLPEDSSTQLMFALGTRCADWTSVPLDAIESVEVLETVPCRDHTHPLVTLRLKAPESSEGAMFAALLSAALKRRVVRRVVQPLHTTGPTPIRARQALVRSDILIGPETPVPGGCAVACNPYEVDEQGNIYELYSCQTFGSSYVCYYQ